MQLTLILCTVLVLSVNIQLLHGTREKRQSFTLGFPVNERKESFFEVNGQTLVQLTGENTATFQLEETESATCDPTVGTITSPSLVLPGVAVTQCANITMATINIEDTDPVMFGGPGTLYVGPNQILFISSDPQSQQFANLIEGRRPLFPPVIPDLEILYPKRDDRIIINLDNVNAGDNDPVFSDDGLQLNGANCTNLMAGDAVTYVSDTITVRRGAAFLIGPLMNVRGLDSVLEQFIAGQRCLVLDRDSETRSGFLSGPGFFCTGVGGLLGNQEALFTNSTSTMNDIIDTVIECQIGCQVSDQGAMLTRTFMPNDGAGLVRLDGAERAEFPTAYVKEQVDGAVNIADRFGNVLQQYNCPGQGIDFSCFHLYQIMVFHDTDNTGGPLRVASGGLTVWYNQEDCTVFAYPTALLPLTLLTFECLELSAVTPAPPVVFSSMFDFLGGSSLLANGMSILTSSSAMSFNIGAGQTVAYSSGSLSVFNSGATDAAFSIGGVNTFTANTAANSLRMFQNSASNIFSGAGALFVDNDGRALFTNSQSVVNLIQSSVITTPMQTVDILPGMRVNGSAVINLQIGGNTFFTITSNANGMNVMNVEGLAYNDGVVGVAQAQITPPNSVLMFLESENLIQVTGSDGNPLDNITDVQGLLIQRSIGGLLEFPGDEPFSGGGILYRGTDSSFYLPSNLITPTIFEDFVTNNVIEDISGGNVIEMCTFFDGTRVQVLNGSSMNVLLGPGYVIISPDSCFYTNNPNLINRLPGEISSIRPVGVSYDPNTGDVSVTMADGTLIVGLPVNSRTVRAPTGLIFYDGNNINSSSEGNNLLASGISNFIYYDGVQPQTITPDSDPLPGGGMLVIDEDTGTAFYTIDPLTIERVMNIINGALGTLVAPNIPDTPPMTQTSKLNSLEGGFGQILTVYEGANVSLVCDAGNANPPADITFSVNTNFTEPDYMAVMDGDEGVMITMGVNNATLLLTAMVGEFEYRCEAENNAGTAFKSTRVIVRPREDVTIDNFFFPGIPGPNSAAVGARTPTPLSFTNPQPISVQTITPIISPDENDTVIDDTSQLVNTVAIGCKARGRPKASITWEVSAGGGARMDVGDVFEFTVEEARQGQSVLMVDLEGVAAEEYTFYCTADNGGPTAEGQAIVSPQRFAIESETAIEMGDCSASCGVGVRTTVFRYTREFEGTEEPVMFEDLPPGLVKPNVNFCFLEECPMVEFMFMAGEFSNCSEFCKGGVMTRDVECFMLVDGTINGTVGEGNCTEFGLETLENTQVCNDRPCPAYIVPEFGMCSQTCRTGIRARNVTCLMPSFNNETGVFFFDEEEGELVDLEICQNFSRQVEPVGMEECNTEIPCPVRYLPGDYGECDQYSCQERDVTCVNFDPSDPLEAWPADESVCIDQGLIRPHSVRDCGGGLCNFGLWVAEEMGPCSEICGFGVQLRQVMCQNVTESDPEMAIIEEGYCSSALRPEEEVPCFIQNCPDRCEVEPRVCVLIKRARMCKNTALASFTESCCISCPFQATPIPEPVQPVMTTDAPTDTMGTDSSTTMTP